MTHPLLGLFLSPPFLVFSLASFVCKNMFFLLFLMPAFFVSSNLLLFWREKLINHYAFFFLQPNHWKLNVAHFIAEFTPVFRLFYPFIPGILREGVLSMDFRPGPIFGIKIKSSREVAEKNRFRKSGIPKCWVGNPTLVTTVTFEPFRIRYIWGD